MKLLIILSSLIRLISRQTKRSVRGIFSHYKFTLVFATAGLIILTGFSPTGPVDDPLALNYHLMHPGGLSAPGDPNAAFYLDGTYHLHYILRHPWQGKSSFSFVHVTSPDMLHWSWQTTKLQPSFTGHGMYSGTGFITKEGRPAAIYHGQGSDKNQIAIATTPDIDLKGRIGDRACR